MASPFGKLRLIANPAAGHGRNPILPRLEKALHDHDLEFEVARTRGPGHAIRLAREWVTDEGNQFVVAVGGDGTNHEVVNGLVDPVDGPVNPEAVLGVVPAGTGSDFCRTFGLDRDPETLARHLAGETLYPIDVGTVTYQGREGDEVARCFINIAEVGFGSDVTDKANGLPRQLGKAKYVLATIYGARRLREVEATVTIDHTEVSEPMVQMVVANGQFFGGNMHVAPRATPDDGLFDVQLWSGDLKTLLGLFQKIRSGSHLPNPNVRQYNTANMHVEAAEPMLIEADGEVLGTTPCTFGLLPKAVNLKI